MAFIFSPFADVIDGSRPAIFEYLSGPAWATANDGATALVFCNPVGAENGLINGDPNLATLNPSAYARFGIPDNGERDEKAIVDWVAQCLMLRQLVPGLPNDLTGKFEDQTPAIMAKLKAAHTGRKALDTSDARASRSIGTVIQSLAEQLNVRTEPLKRPRGRGSFTDDFEGEVADVDLSLHTPSGGTSWTRATGAAESLKVDPTGILQKSITAAPALYVAAPDQGGGGGTPEHYSTAVLVSTGEKRAGCTHRYADTSNYIYFIIDLTNRFRIHKVVAGSDSQLAISTSESWTADDIIRFESDGTDAHEMLQNGVSALGPVTDAAGNTNTAQGLRVDTNANAYDVFKSFEAGDLNAVAATTGRTAPVGMIGGVGRIGMLGSI